jgi:hypothetical protein
MFQDFFFHFFSNPNLKFSTKKRLLSNDFFDISISNTKKS